ncbi:hypothetical protein GCM10017674_64380 [Streptomyces gardneri]|nr:hypothetical protein GCM10017674_64380 [Streptomyces gardneri]
MLRTPHPTPADPPHPARSPYPRPLPARPTGPRAPTGRTTRPYPGGRSPGLSGSLRDSVGPGDPVRPATHCGHARHTAARTPRRPGSQIWGRPTHAVRTRPFRPWTTPGPIKGGDP